MNICVHNTRGKYFITLKTDDDFLLCDKDFSRFFQMELKDYQDIMINRFNATKFDEIFFNTREEAYIAIEWMKGAILALKLAKC